MLERTKIKSLDALEDLMDGFSRQYADNNIQDDRSNIGSDDPGVEVGVNERDNDGHRQSRSVRTSRSIMAAFARTCYDEGSRGSQNDERITAMTVNNGSVFVPPGREG